MLLRISCCLLSLWRLVNILIKPILRPGETFIGVFTALMFEHASGIVGKGKDGGVLDCLLRSLAGSTCCVHAAVALGFTPWRSRGSDSTPSC